MRQKFPPYINRSADYNSGLPYSFIGARYYNFILQGNPLKMKRLCDVYLNRPSGFEVNVKPFAPYVIVTFARYPKAYSQALNPAIYGFMQYDEAIFTMVVEQSNGICGVGAATYSFIPYLFLDNPRAIVAGREVFSLPKVHGVVTIPDAAKLECPCQFDCTLNTLPSFGPNIQARNMEIVRIEAPNGLVALGSEKDPKSAWNEIDSHVYSQFDGDSGVTQAQSKTLTRSSQLKFINLRQFRGFPHTSQAVGKSIFGYQAVNVHMLNGGALLGKTHMTFPESSPLFPIVESLGLIPRVISAFWYEWTFQFAMGENIWTADE